MLAAVHDPAFVLDESDRIQNMNAAAKRFLGKDTEGRTLSSLLGSADMISFLKRSRERETGKDIVPEEIFMRRTPSRDVWVEATAASVGGVGEIEGQELLLVILRDVTRRKQLEALRRDFVANVSHDMRTPVTILKGYAEMLNEDFDRLDDTEKKRFVERIHRNTGRLNRLLEDMLQLAILENGVVPVNLQKGVLHEALRESVDTMSDRIAQAKVSVQLGLDANDSELAVDPQKIMRIMLNLIENALRHAEGITCIRISTTNGQGDKIVVSVTDDGAGMAQTDMVRMFERFFRADKSRTGEKGTGLGLSIVKHLMGLHGGTVTAAPNKPKGLIIRLEFPVAPTLPGLLNDIDEV
ncbi:MAG: PAS domain S-box protein [Puniceicoccales bacterium]|nr:PAS domain S-box protein [Puniceicoccales bacterium]